QAKSLQQNNPDYTFVKRKNWSGNGLYANMQRPPTSDPRVRAALWKAVDRQQYIDGVLLGEGWWSSGLRLPSERAQLPDDELKRLLARDVAGAKQLLQQAGVTNWTPTLLISVTDP